MPEEQSARERLLEQERCGVCGLVHPFLKVCPFIEEAEVRYEFGLVDGRRKVRSRIERTKYFPRPQVFEALEAAIAAEATPVKSEPPPAPKARKPRRTTTA